MQRKDVENLRRIVARRDGVWHAVDPASDKTAWGIAKLTVSAVEPGVARGVTCKRCLRALT